MPRLTIEVTDSQYRQLEALASSAGMDIAEFMLMRSLESEMTEADALQILGDHLAPALEQTKCGETIPLDMNAIIKKARERRNNH